MTAASGAADPAGHGAGRIGAFTVLFDEHCPVCRTARRWLESRDQLVPLRFVAAGSAEARRLFPTLDHAATLRDLTLIGDEGSVYAGDGAWVACLWALADYRATAERISSPALLPTARRLIAAASALREATRTPLPPAAAVTPIPEVAKGAPIPEVAIRAPIPPTATGTPGRPEATCAPTAREPHPPAAADYGDGCDDRCR